MTNLTVLPEWVDESLRCMIKRALSVRLNGTVFVLVSDEGDGLMISPSVEYAKQDPKLYDNALASIRDVYEKHPDYQQLTPSVLMCSWAGSILRRYMTGGHVSSLRDDTLVVAYWGGGSVYVAVEHPEVFQESPPPALVLFKNADSKFAIATYTADELA